jgi:hypothetical protein
LPVLVFLNADGDREAGGTGILQAENPAVSFDG